MRWLALILWLVPTWGTLLPKAEAQALTLARVCVAEGGWRTVQTGDCAAIAAVLRRRSPTGRVTRRMACLYSAHACDKRRRHRRWVAHLREDAQRPDYWPRRLSWPNHRGAWRETLVHASRLVAGERLDRCRRRPDHWGAPWFTTNAHRNGWRRVDCGATSNAFWRVP